MQDIFVYFHRNCNFNLKEIKVISGIAILK